MMLGNHFTVNSLIQMTETFKIIRFCFQGENRVIKRGLTLEEAKEWCSKEETHGEGWFDGFDEE